MIALALTLVVSVVTGFVLGGGLSDDRGSDHPGPVLIDLKASGFDEAFRSEGMKIARPGACECQSRSCEPRRWVAPRWPGS
jgi:hypothetical protein